MSALLIDDLRAGCVVGGEPAALRDPRVIDEGSLASVTVLPVARAERSASAWRLTDRGIVVVMTLFVGLFVAGVIVAVSSFLAVSDAPLADGGAGVAAVSVQR